MTHGYRRTQTGYQRRRRAWRTKRRIRRGQLKPMEAYQSRYDRLIPRTHWNRKHPHYRRFSFANRIRGFGKNEKRKL